MVKITAYNDELPLALAGAGGIIISNNSRTSLGSNTPLIESGAGSPGSGPQAAAWDHVHPEFGGGGGSSSFGSNSTRVSSVSSAGASSSNSRADHVHQGVASIAKAGSAALYGVVTLTGGTNVTLTQSGQDISIAASGGGGGGASAGGYSIFPLDRTTVSGMDGTFGDDFTGGSLDAKWTRVNQAGSEESYAQGIRASALRVTYSNAAASRYIYQASPAGDWTFEASCTIWEPAETGNMFGILALNSSGTGVAAHLYENGFGLYLSNVTTGVFGSTLTSILFPARGYQSGRRIWLRLRKASGVYHASMSQDGESYSIEATGTPSTFTLARVGLGRFLGTTTNDVVDWHWFDKTA